MAADVGQQPLFPEAAHLVSSRRLSSETGAPPSAPPASPPALREFLGTVSFVIIIVVALVLVAVCNGIGYLCYIRADQWFPGTALAELSRASVVRKSMVFIDAPAGGGASSSCATRSAPRSSVANSLYAIMPPPRARDLSCRWKCASLRWTLLAWLSVSLSEVSVAEIDVWRKKHHGHKLIQKNPSGYFLR